MGAPGSEWPRGAARVIHNAGGRCSSPCVKQTKGLAKLSLVFLRTVSGESLKASDVAQLINQTYHSAFDDPTRDVELDYSRSVATRCDTQEHASEHTRPD